MRKTRRFRRWTSEDQRRADFYRQFVPERAVVFDVGANMGNRAKVFIRLDASVVAVEPQRQCADFLSGVFKGEPRFHLERTALGEREGESEMLISNADTISSLSPDWVRSVKESGRFSEYEWNRKETVRVDTLENLIAQHGRPDFIKIDVEGFEDKVLKGLNTPVRAISLEFTPEFIQSTHACIEHLGCIGDYRFQLSLGETMEFSLPNWVNAQEIRERLSELPLQCFGDIYARCNDGLGKLQVAA